MSLYIGLMSGTSMDGIDAALVELPANRLICGITKKYSDELKEQLIYLMADKNLNLSLIPQLNTWVGREFAHAVNELLDDAKLAPQAITAIGSHGQTVCHDTTGAIPYTLQLGCGHTISSLTKIPVVADFRTRDLVNGGQGAPFAPLYHQELFSSSAEEVALVNIGGISNITFVSPNNPTLGWDVGPGNCLMDAWINEHLGLIFDKDGVWAQQGQIINALLEQLKADPFFAKNSPKSIGKEYFSLDWLKSHLNKEYRPVDVQATLLALTATSIADNILNYKNSVRRLYLCGGGTHNRYLFQFLEHLLPKIDVLSSESAGISPDYLEAMMFAWLASQTLNNKPVNLKSITGTKVAALLGAIYPIKSY